MWSGTMEDIPTGWALCDGTNGTLDLRNRFIIGAGDLYAVGNTGGSANATLVSHTHTGNTTTTSDNHAHNLAVRRFIGGNDVSRGGTFGAGTISTGAGDSAHSHTVTVETVGEDVTNKNLPPYYALAFIQQVE
jgi:microcystin-dependent protein